MKTYAQRLAADVENLMEDLAFAGVVVTRKVRLTTGEVISVEQDFESREVGNARLEVLFMTASTYPEYFQVLPVRYDSAKESSTTEQPEDGPVAWGVEFNGKLYRNVRPSYERVSLQVMVVGDPDGRVVPLYPESVKAERDALRANLDRSKARTDRAVNEIRALRERVKELEADAARYQLLRSHADTEWHDNDYIIRLRDIPVLVATDDIDPVIDTVSAAMQEGKS